MSTISASTTTTTAYKVTADTTGTLVLQTGSTPTTAVTIGTNQVVTFAQAPSLPAGSIPQAALAANVAGNGPAFYAYSSGSFYIAPAVNTKLPLNTEAYDTNNCFDSSTNYRFTPNVAGYYLISCCITGTYGTGNTASYIASMIYKNGSLYSACNTLSANNGNYACSNTTAVIYLNGSTDYIEFYGSSNNGGNFTLQSQGTTYGTYMSGALVRAA